jgi:ubiquinone/menaquinone biosynthesis C-methylase UbiE
MSKDSVSKYYDQMGEQYTLKQREFFSDKKDWSREKIRSAFNSIKGEKILDIGCGGGDDIAWFEKQGAEVYGIDISTAMLELARKNVAHPENIKEGSYQNIPFPENYFDVVLGRFSLHYLKSFDSAYKEIARVLKRDGTLVQLVSHPTFDSSHTADSGGNIHIELYSGKVIVSFPPHTFNDYFSTTFNNLFELKGQDEDVSLDAKNPNKLPEMLFYKAIKR